MPKKTENTGEKAKTRRGGSQKAYAPGEFKENEYSGLTFADAVQKYYRSIVYEEKLYKLVETGEFNAKGKPIYERQPIIVERDGEEVQATKLSYTVPPSVQGLCLALKIDPRTFERYEKVDEYAFTCSWWKLVCHAYNTELLLTKEGNVQGVTFNLKNNFGWTDKQEVQVSGGIEKYLESLAEGTDGKSGQVL